MRRILAKKGMKKCVLAGMLIFFWIAVVTSGVYADQGDASIDGFVGIGIGPNDTDFDYGATISGGGGFGYEVMTACSCGQILVTLSGVINSMTLQLALSHKTSVIFLFF